MKIGIFLSIDKGGSPLQGGLERALTQLGHDVQQYRQGEGYDLVLMFNQAAHMTDYVYPEFPSCKSPIVFIDSAEYGPKTRVDEVIAGYTTAFMPPALAHKTKSPEQQARMMRFLEGRSFPYFLSEYSDRVEYPCSYHPIAYPLYCMSADAPDPIREQYLSRDLDLFVAWGASTDERETLAEELRRANTKCEITVIGEGFVPDKLPQDVYFYRMLQAKCSPSSEGHGSICFRVTEVLMRSCLLMGKLRIKMNAPLIDGETCRLYEMNEDGTSNIVEVLRDVLSDPEAAYSIYEAGYHHCMQHYTEKATAQYVLDTIEKHDWSKPTQLTVKAVGRPQ